MMNPMQGGQGVYLGTDFDGVINGMRQKIEDANQVGLRLAEFLAKAFPDATAQAMALGSSVSTYLISGFAETIDAMEQQRAVAAPSFRNSPVERLAQLCKERDNIQSQLDVADEAIKNYADAPGGDIRAIGINTMLSSSRNQLDWYNEQISELQREMEKAEA